MKESIESIYRTYKIGKVGNKGEETLARGFKDLIKIVIEENQYEEPIVEIFRRGKTRVKVKIHFSYKEKYSWTDDPYSWQINQPPRRMTQEFIITLTDSEENISI